MREKLTIVKVGGKIVEEEATLFQLLDDFSSIEGYKLLVHGGGRSATKIAAALGIESRRSEEHTSELQSRQYLVCRLLLEKKKKSFTTLQIHVSTSSRMYFAGG